MISSTSSDTADMASQCDSDAMSRVRRYRPVMFAGTGSDVGKSVIAAGICRVLCQDGLQPAPFKAQNMALNSYVTPEGLEIGRAQAMQAEASGIECCAEMNPILLKPQSDGHSQVVMLGKPVGVASAYSYFSKKGREKWRSVVQKAFDRLSAIYSPIIMEGAGSISEINLRDVDIVNMPMARYAGASVILVADIDRGGVFASVYGSIMLQTPEDRKRIKGIIINKFRGDVRLFESGVKLIEELCGVPVLGVIPYFKDITLDAEDSLALTCKKDKAVEGKVNVVVVRVPHISNFTDFDTFEAVEGVNLYYSFDRNEIAKADIIILPGTKSTIADLEELRNNDLDKVIVRAANEGKTVIGICGGYQMMGLTVADPHGTEGEAGKSVNGLGILPVDTVMTDVKRTVRVKAIFANKDSEESGERMDAYEIHMGHTVIHDNSLADHLHLIFENDQISDGKPEGVRCNNSLGTYLHGILDNPEFLRHILRRYGIVPDMDNRIQWKEKQYDRLAAHIREHMDMAKFYEILTDQNND